MSQENTQVSPTPPDPTSNPTLRRLDGLVGKWIMTGRSLNASEDDIFGTANFEWLPGGHFLQNSGEIEARGF